MEERESVKHISVVSNEAIDDGTGYQSPASRNMLVSYTRSVVRKSCAPTTRAAMDMPLPQATLNPLVA